MVIILIDRYSKIKVLAVFALMIQLFVGLDPGSFDTFYNFYKKHGDNLLFVGVLGLAG